MKTLSKYSFRPKLTKRELEIVELIVFEYSTKEIAQQLFLSFETIKTHRHRIMQKLNVRSVAGIVREAILKNHITPKEELRLAM